MTKVELEQHWVTYHAWVRDAQNAIGARQFRRAIELAVGAWPAIDGMMQYAKRYENKTFDSLEAFNIVFRLAPLTFDSTSLDALAELLKKQRKIDRNTTADEPAILVQARQRMLDARRLWNLIERHGPVLESQLGLLLGGEQDQWRALSEEWVAMGILIRAAEGSSARLQMATQMGAIIGAICISCGIAIKREKRAHLDSGRCPKCGSRTGTVLFE